MKISEDKGVIPDCYQSGRRRRGERTVFPTRAGLYFYDKGLKSLIGKVHFFHNIYG